MIRLISGLLIAPFISAVIAALVAMQLADVNTGMIMAFGCLVGGYAGAFAFGLPLLFLWKRCGWIGPIAITLLGVVSAAFVTLLVVLMLAPGRDNTPWYVGFIRLSLVGLPLGAIAGAAFWWLGMRTSVRQNKVGSSRK